MLYSCTHVATVGVVALKQSVFGAVCSTGSHVNKCVGLYKTELTNESAEKANS